MKELWRSLPNYENFYEISNFGKIRSKGGRAGNYIARELKQKKNRDGYLYFRLNNEISKQRLFSAHRAVAITFIPNLENKSQVNHIDFDRHNNHVSNLEWVTPKENAAHKFASGRHRGGKVGGRKGTKFGIVGYKQGMTATKEGKKIYMRQYRLLKKG